MGQTRRIIRNTLFSYGQSLFALAVSLFSARWILEGLGQVDLGLFGVVGSLIALIVFLNGGLAVSTSRFYAHSIGEWQKLQRPGVNQELKGWFNSSLSLYLILPMVFIALGWPIGEYVIRHQLNIPPERLAACLIVFRLSLFNLFFSLSSVPFIAMYTARQHFGEIAISGIIRSTLNLLIAWIILHVQSDRLITYSILMVSLDVIIQLFRIGRAMRIFPECRPDFSLMYHKEKLRRFFGYSGWKLFGMSCVAGRDQGSPILINLAFGPAMNATYSIANRLATQANTLSNSLTQAFGPALFAAEGKGDRQGMLRMSIQVCRFGSLLVLLFSIPLILEAKEVFNLWLKNPPPYCAEICQYLLVILIADRMTTGPMMAVNAYGKIAAYEIIQGSAILFTLPLMWLLVQMGIGPIAIGQALLLSSFAYFIGRLIFCRILLQAPISIWLKEVLLPLSAIILISYAAGWATRSSLEPGFLRILATSAVSAGLVLLISWFLLLRTAERRQIHTKVTQLFHKEQIT